MLLISTGFRQHTYLPVSCFSAAWFTGWQIFGEHWEMWYLCFWRAEMKSTVVHLSITFSKKSTALRCTQHLSLDREHWPGLSDLSVTLGWCYHMSVYFCGSSWCSCDGPQPSLPTQPDRVNSHWQMKVYRQLRSLSLSLFCSVPPPCPSSNARLVCITIFTPHTGVTALLISLNLLMD